MTSLNRINFGIEQETGLPYKAQANMAYSMIWKSEIEIGIAFNSCVPS